MADARVSGKRVIVAGAGLAGLTAARDLEARGADVMVIDARRRVGGRVHTIREGFAAGQHAEAGADLIEAGQSEVRQLARELGLETSRILRAGFGYYGADAAGRRRIRNGPGAFAAASKKLRQEIADYLVAEKRWDSAVAVSLGRQSVAQWLERTRADRSLASGLRGLRGFFLADPEDLSLIALVDQFAAGGEPGEGEIFRIRGGNGRLAETMAGALRGRLLLETVLRAVRQDARGVRAAVEQNGRRTELRADFMVSAMPASTLRDVQFSPALPDEQRQAIQTLRYGCATRLLLQFARPYWRRARRPRAFGTDLPVGAVWDGAEDQRSGPGILSFLAGGRASAELQQILGAEGTAGVLRHLRWLGMAPDVLASRRITWEQDRWARGGYAYFDPSFDTRLRQWLARPFGRVVFAGEHTSLRWQGYMNGAVESGRRAAAEVPALARGGGLRHFG